MNLAEVIAIIRPAIDMRQEGMGTSDRHEDAPMEAQKLFRLYQEEDKELEKPVAHTHGTPISGGTRL